MVEAIAFYERLDDETFVATRATQSPWDESLQHGGPPTALIARVMAERFPRSDMRFGRVAAEFLGPIPIATMRVRTRVARAGRRIEMLEGAIESDGKEVVLVRAWRIAAGGRAVPPASTPPDVVPALPAEQPSPAWLREFGYGAASEWRYVSGKEGLGPAAVWSRPRVSLISGQAILPLDRALIVADSANGVSAELPMDDWMFVPPSLSLAFERYPEGEWTLLEARTTLSNDGLGVTSIRLGDRGGYIAAGTQALFVGKR
jgi:hypothetical protein